MIKLELISYMLVPMIIIIIVVNALIKKEKVYDCFLDGAREGTKTVFNIFPTILAISIAMAVFRESGALNILIEIISPVAKVLNVPKEILPLGFMSSISGGASLGILSDTIKEYGPDSVIGMTASAVLGSSETTLYVLAIYTATTNIKNTRGALWIGLFCDLVAFLIAVWMCQ